MKPRHGWPRFWLGLALTVTGGALGAFGPGLRLVIPDEPAAASASHRLPPLRPTRVVDGDTFHAVDPEGVDRTLRIALIDAPERDQPWSGESAHGLLALLMDSAGMARSLDCVEVTRDRYGRSIVRCALPDGRDLSAEMVRQGWAWPYLDYGGAELVEIWREAVCAGVGLWSTGVEPPWLHRRCKATPRDPEPPP